MSPKRLGFILGSVAFNASGKWALSDGFSSRKNGMRSRDAGFWKPAPGAILDFTKRILVGSFFQKGCFGMKTNAARLLEEQGIAFQLREYEVDEQHIDAETVAGKVGLAPEQVFKTLVVRGDREGVCLAVVPGNAELDLKALAKLSGNRKMEMVALKEVQPLTGYVRGGVTALGLKKPFPVFVDETVILFKEIAVSAGVRGTQIVLRPEDYLRAVNGVVGEIGRELS